MFNLGNNVNVCVALGIRSVKYVYLGNTRIYTCCRCIPTVAKDIDFADVLYVSDMNTSVCDCSNYNTKLNLARIHPNTARPAISPDDYVTPDTNPNGAVQGSLYFGSGGYGWMNLPRTLGGAFTVEAWAYRETNTNWVENPDLLFFSILGGTGDSIYVLVGSHNVGVRNNMWTLNNVETSASAPLNTWQHVALSGGVIGDLTTNGRMTLYIDGVAAATQLYQADSNTGGYADFVDLRRVTVGIGGGPDIYGGSGYTFPGYMDDLRVTAAERYRSNFTPPDSPMPNIILPADDVPPPTGPTDPHFQNVEFLLHCDSNCPRPGQLRDNSKNNRVVYAHNTFLIINKQSGNQSPVGDNQSAATDPDRGVLKLSDTAWSDYSGGPYIQVAATGNNLSAGTGDYTFEFWGKINGGGNVFISTQGLGLGRYWCSVWAGQPQWAGYAFRAILQMKYFSPSNPYGIVNIWAVDVTGILGSWAHIAISRSGGLTRVFINGVAQPLGINGGWEEPYNPFATMAADGAAPDGSNLDFTSAVYFTTLGTDAMAIFGFAADAFSGYVDEVRYTKGIGRYTSNFTPPTDPHPDRGPT